MSKSRHLTFRCLLLLACNLALINFSAQDEGDLTRTLSTIESRKQALSELTEERARLLETGNKAALVRVTNKVAQIHLKLHDFDSALTEAKQSLNIVRQLEPEDHQLLVDTLIVQAHAHLESEQYLTAERLLNEALERSRNHSYRHGQAQSLTYLGVAYYHLSDLSKSVMSHDAALEIWRELQDKRGEALALTRQGETYMRQDDVERAKIVLENAETIWRDLGYAVERATTLVDLSFLAIRQGQWQSALVALDQAQQLLEDKQAEPYLAGQIAMSFGEVHEAYGQLESALEYFRESLLHYRDGAHNKSAAIDAGNKAGRVQARLGDHLAAKEQIESGLRLAQEIGDDLMTGLCHEDLGRVWLLAESYEQARAEFRSAIMYFEKTGNRRLWARAQSFLGETEYLLKNSEQAAKSYHKARRFFEEVQDYTNEAALSFGLGKLALDQQRLDEAGKYLERSINLTEHLRENAASKDLRSSFLASVHDRYETYVEWLMTLHGRKPNLGFDIKAFEASEAGRARSLLDSLRDHHQELREVSNPVLLAKEEELQKKEQTLLDKRAKLVTKDETGERARVESELIRVRAQNETLQAQLKSSVRFTNLLRPPSLSYPSIQRQLTDSDTSLLEFSLGNRKSFVWLVTPDGLTHYELPDKHTIEKASRHLVELLKNPRKDPDYKIELETAIEQVSQFALGELRSKLRGSRLIIVADGVLQYVPFQILTATANTPLISSFEIVYTPSASVLAIARQENIQRAASPKLLVGFGDPVVSSNHSGQTLRRGSLESTNGKPETQRSTDKHHEVLDPNKLPNLFYARRELRAIGNLAGKGGSALYLKYDATRNNLRHLDLSQFRILHLATHGVLNANQPELSGLVFTTIDANGQPLDGFVGLADIFKLRAPVSLVVLSACDTALGKDLRGEGLIGVTRGFMYAGASSVVASLWKVEDEVTSEIMKHFYTNMLQRGMPPAAALRAAQNSIREQPQWSSPYYWAAFTFQGDHTQRITAIPEVQEPIYQRLIAAGALGVALAAFAWWIVRFRRVRARNKLVIGR